MKKTSVFYELAVLLLTVVLLAWLLFSLGSAMMPQRTTFGAVWSSYLQEEPDTIDVLFLGSSRAYCNVIPAELYARSGLTSYVMAGPSQTTPLTWYYLRQCLKTQSPKYVFVEVSGALYPLYEEFSKVNVVYMPFSADRFRAAASCEEGILGVALYPLGEFHDRVYDCLEGEPSKAEEGRMLCGYTPLAEATDQTEPAGPALELPEPEVYAHNLDYLRQIAQLCQQRQIQCVFYYAPTNRAMSTQAAAQLFADLEQMPCRGVEDWSDLQTRLDIDPTADWYDTIHFNTRGAVKYTDFLADYCTDELGAQPTAGADGALWQQRLAWLDLP